jgi:hypothetical protein
MIDIDISWMYRKSKQMERLPFAFGVELEMFFLTPDSHDLEVQS